MSSPQPSSCSSAGPSISTGAIPKTPPPGRTWGRPPWWGRPIPSRTRRRETRTLPPRKAAGQRGRCHPGGPGRRESSYFSTARLNRQQARDNALSLLQEAAKDEKADQAAVDEANQAIQTMADATMTEAQIENLITAKGYADCVAFLGEDSISVVVSAMENGMTDADAARIGEIVKEQTGLNADQIKIIEAE
ncbi:MAG: SpoIIIAH-like family protein [Evtepia sp.]